MAMHRIKELNGVVGGSKQGVTVAAVLFVLFGPAIASAGDLSGHVFIRTTVGEAKRIADLQVTLIRATRDFEAAWQDLVAAFERERAAALEASRQAESEKTAAQVEYMRLVGAGGPAFADAVAREKAAFEQLERARKAAAALPGQYPEKATALIRQHQSRTVRTGVDGQYKLPEVPSGRHYVFAEHKVVEHRQIRMLGPIPVILAHFVWFVPITVTQQATALDLAGSNSGWPFTPLKLD